MKRRAFALGAAAALPAFSGLLALPAQAQSGPGYATLKPIAPVDTKPPQIEVVEFFSYGCSHCKNFEPIFSAWKKAAPKDVVVRMVHVGFNKSFEPLQRLYYALESMGEVDKLHAKVFEALQTERKRLNQPEVLFPWIAEQGVDRAKFEETYKSFGVASKVQRAGQLQEAYRVEGTPAVGVAGKYYTDGSMAGGFERMIQLTNNLIAQERKQG
ncbi:MAG: thiol:disulfide interchange protein DsbA/DsbL [Pseudomonadota bacterium]|nr:thiol:disulfide interchange protein DsbA/DsbL [Pseudomonadota bacterium]